MLGYPPQGVADAAVIGGEGAGHPLQAREGPAPLQEPGQVAGGVADGAFGVKGVGGGSPSIRATSAQVLLRNWARPKAPVGLTARGSKRLSTWKRA